MVCLLLRKDDKHGWQVHMQVQWRQWVYLSHVRPHACRYREQAYSWRRPHRCIIASFRTKGSSTPSFTTPQAMVKKNALADNMAAQPPRAVGNCAEVSQRVEARKPVRAACGTFHAVRNPTLRALRHAFHTGL